MSTSPKERLVEFARHFAAGEYERALAIIDALLAEHPARDRCTGSGRARWKARALRRGQAAAKRVIELRPQFARRG
jgi:hypothetical protein